MNTTQIREQQARLSTKAKTLKRLLSNPSASNIRQIESVNDECNDIEAKLSESMMLTEIKSANFARLNAFGPSPKPSAEISSFANVRYILGRTTEEKQLKGYKLGNWALATLRKNPRAIDYCKSQGIPLNNLKAASQGVDELGGAIVPEEIDSIIRELKETYGVARSHAKLFRMTSDSALVPKITGTVTVAYLPEGGNLTDSSQTWTNIRLTVQKAGCLIVASNEIAEDAVINFADNLAQESAWALSQTEDLAAFTGDGTSTYGGQVGVTTQLKLLDSTIGNIAGLTVGTGNTYAELTLADFQNAAAKLPAYADNPRTRWFMNRSFYVGTAQRLATAAGVTPFPDPATGLQTFLAYPVQFTQVLPKAEADSQVCALLGDLSLSTDFGDRRFTGIRLDPFSLAHKDQIQVSVTSRFHIVTHSIGNASSVAADRVPGPIVGLITAAS